MVCDVFGKRKKLISDLTEDYIEEEKIMENESNGLLKTNGISCNRAKKVRWIIAVLALAAVAAVIIGVYINKTNDIDEDVSSIVDISIYEEAKKDDGTYRQFSGVVKRRYARYGVKGKYAVVIEGWPGENGECIIRSRVRGKKVAGVSKWTFAERRYNMGCYYLTNVTIPDSIVYIEEGAFSYAVALEKITVDKGNKHYYDMDGILFSADNRIIAYPIKKAGNEYNIPDNVTGIGDRAFCDCDNLTSITIPNSVINIGEEAFFWCDNLSAITVPDSVTTIENDAFCTYSAITVKAPHDPSYYGYTPTENETWVIE